MKSEKKRILFIIPSLNDGGAEKVLIDILKRMDYEKYSIDLLLDYRTGSLVEDVPEKVNMFYIHKTFALYHRIRQKVMRTLKLNVAYHNWSLIPRMKRKIGNRRYDTIVSFLEGPALYFHSKLMGYGKKHVTWVHCDLMKNHWTVDACSYRGNMEERIYNMMDRIVFVSGDAKDALNRMYTIKKEQTVLYNPIDMEEINRKAGEKEVVKSKTTLCTVCRLVPVKNIGLLLKAVKRIKDDGLDAEVWIVGDGYMMKELKSQAESMNLKDEVKFLGFMRNPYPYMKAADIYISTSDSEGYPLTVCEAICLGKPVISTRTTGGTEILNNGEYGLMAGHDEESVYRCIKLLLENREEMDRYAGLSALRAKDINNADNFMKEIESIV